MHLWRVADEPAAASMPWLPDLPPDPPAQALAATDMPPGPLPRWTPARVAIADELWGDGNVLPGGEDEVLRLAAPLGLSAASSVLLLGAAGGGAARAIAGGLGAWVSGHEADPALAAVAAWRLPRAGKVVARRASVAAWNPQAPVFSRRAFHHALALEALRGAPWRPVPVAELLVALAGALRPGGQLVLVDVVATARLDPEDPLVRCWARSRGGRPTCPPRPRCPPPWPGSASTCGWSRICRPATCAWRCRAGSAWCAPCQPPARTGCALPPWSPRRRCGCAG